MKKRFIVANWKSYKTSVEAKSWLKDIAKFQFPNSNEKEVIVCAPYTSLSLIKEQIDKETLPMRLGAQDVSPFVEGAYTGEVTAAQVKEFATYTIVGHSERRKYFKEDDNLLTQKVAMALQNSLTPIFCVQDENTYIPEGVTIVAYEPIFAIGSGQPDTPQNAEKVVKTIKEKTNIHFVLYGGSVKPENIQSFTSSPSIDGALIGGASLDAQKFIQLIQNA